MAKKLKLDAEEQPMSEPLFAGPAVSFGLGPVAEGRWLAFRQTHGQEPEILTPMRHGTHWGESKHSAAGRMNEAIRKEFVQTAIRRIG